MFFGAAIGLVSCWRGFTCAGGASGVGRAATSAFVTSFLAINVINLVSGELPERALLRDLPHGNPFGAWLTWRNPPGERCEDSDGCPTGHLQENQHARLEQHHVPGGLPRVPRDVRAVGPLRNRRWSRTRPPGQGRSHHPRTPGPGARRLPLYRSDPRGYTVGLAIDIGATSQTRGVPDPFLSLGGSITIAAATVDTATVSDLRGLETSIRLNGIPQNTSARVEGDPLSGSQRISLGIPEARCRRSRPA